MSYTAADLMALYIFCDLVDYLQTVRQLVVQSRLGFGLFDKDKDGQERDCFAGCIVGENVVEYEFGKDELVSRVDLYHKTSPTNSENARSPRKPLYP